MGYKGEHDKEDFDEEYLTTVDCTHIIKIIKGFSPKKMAPPRRNLPERRMNDATHNNYCFTMIEAFTSVQPYSLISFFNSSTSSGVSEFSGTSALTKADRQPPW